MALRGDYQNVTIIASQFRQKNAGQATEEAGCRIGPSGIKRVNKWLNRRKKAASHAANVLNRAGA